MIYTVTFNPAIDYVVQAEDFRLGEVNRAAREQLLFGGKGINVSCILRELGAESTALGFIAGFTGDFIERSVQAAGVRTDFIRLQSGFSRINVKLHTQTETELNGQGPVITKAALDELFAKLDRLGTGDTLVLAGSIPGSLPADSYEQILSRLDGRGIRFVVDAAGELLERVLPNRPFLVKPNHHELGELTGRELHNESEIIEAARQLQERGARNVLVSRAGDGAVLLCEDGAVHICPAHRGTVVNSVGAGDSMVAGFLAGLETGDAAYALRLGTAAGGATAFSEGLARREDIERLMQEARHV